jgi:DNA-binding PadR family transcriptional regulator
MAGDDSSLELGRFAEPALLVLVSLSDGPKHGYAIMTDVESVSGSNMGPGTLYAVLARLERAGLIEPMPSRDRRRPYRITSLGESALAARLAELQRFVRVGRARLRTPNRGET